LIQSSRNEREVARLRKTRSTVNHVSISFARLQCGQRNNNDDNHSNETEKLIEAKPVQTGSVASLFSFELEGEREQGEQGER
jgi:hypothetical protein